MELEKTLEGISLDVTAFDGLTIVLIIAIAYAATKAIIYTLEGLGDRYPARRLLFKRLLPVFQLVSYGVPAYLIIRILSPDQAARLSLLYAAGIAVGFAGQDLLKDLIGGIVVLGDNSFQVGDRIRIGELYGEVMKIGLRSTKLLTQDNEMITVANAQLQQAALSNVNNGAVNSPITTHIYLSPHADINRIERVVREAVLTSKIICLAKPLSIHVKEVEQDGKLVMDMEIRAYVFDVRFEEAFLTDVTRRAKQAIYDRGLLVEEAEVFDQRVNANLSETLIALGKRFEGDQPLFHRNGY